LRRQARGRRQARVPERVLRQEPVRAPERVRRRVPVSPGQEQVSLVPCRRRQE